MASGGREVKAQSKKTHWLKPPVVPGEIDPMKRARKRERTFVLEKKRVESRPLSTFPKDPARRSLRRWGVEGHVLGYSLGF